jgi:hypothetical protein
MKFRNGTCPMCRHQIEKSQLLDIIVTIPEPAIETKNEGTFNNKEINLYDKLRSANSSKLLVCNKQKKKKKSLIIIY